MSEILEKLAKQLTETEEVANTELAGWDPRTIVGKQGAVRVAKEQVEALTKEYKAEAAKHTVKVFLTGSAKQLQRFTELAPKDDVLVINGEALYIKLAKPVDATVDQNRRVFTSNQFTRLVGELTEYARDTELYVLPMPKMDVNSMGVPVPQFEDVLSLVRDAIRASDQDDLNSYAIERAALDEIVTRRVATPVIPVVITNLSSKSEIANVGEKVLKGRPNITISIRTITTQDDKAFVEAVLDLIATTWAKRT